MSELDTSGLGVSFTDVRFAYPSGVQALDGVSIDIPAGQRVAIVGQNGAGKTTLVRHLNGIFSPTSGRVMVGDTDTKGHTIAKLSALVGYVFQNPDEQLFARKVRDDVAFGPKNLGVEPERIDELVRLALERVGLADEADTHPHHLSLSERKRVALAAVLAMDTPVVVLDEPTTGQDQRGIALIARIIADLNAQGRTVIAITHDMDFCVENFDRVIVMALGTVLADGSPEEVFAKADVLEQARVEAPQLMRLAAALGWADKPRIVAEFVDKLPAR